MLTKIALAIVCLAADSSIRRLVICRSLTSRCHLCGRHLKQQLQRQQQRERQALMWSLQRQGSTRTTLKICRHSWMAVKFRVKMKKGLMQTVKMSAKMRMKMTVKLAAAAVQMRQQQEQQTQMQMR
jgi:hypothetical protein